MPYYITQDKTLTDCPDWALIKKLPDGSVEKVACHPTKESAIAQMIVVSNAEGMKPLGEYVGMGERATTGIKAVISDIDDTLIHHDQQIQDVVDFVVGQDVAIMLVTGRLESERAATEAQLQDLGIDYDRLFMNNLPSTSDSATFKKQTAESLMKDYNILFAIDNDGAARAAYSSLGLTVIDPAHLPANRTDKLKDNTQRNKTVTISKRDMIEPTSVEMAEPTKETLAIQLKDLLGEVVIFKFLAHGFHWNVRGINFQQYHEFFGEIYEDADGSIDPIAESIRKLNFDAPFTLTEFMNSAPEIEPTDSTDPLEMSRSLYIANESVRTCLAKAIDLADELEESGINNFLSERLDMHSKWQWQLRSIVGDSFAKNYEIDLEEVTEDSGQGNENEPAPMGQDKPESGDPNVAGGVADNAPAMSFDMGRSKWATAADLIIRKLEPTQEIPVEDRAKGFETRVNHGEFELREVEGGDGMTFEGYAARFNSPSDPIGGKFTEYIAPGAFTRSIKTRGYDVKLLWNHDTSQVLGSTRSGTLVLTEDSNGLLARATLPDTQAGRDAATLIKRGDVAGMSFGFQVPPGGDSWNTDGTVRTLHNVKLHEVSITAFPAYPASTASVRAETRSIDADVLTAGLTKLEMGESLSDSEANTIREVVGKLTEPVEPMNPDVGLLKKKLELQGKAI